MLQKRYWVLCLFVLAPFLLFSQKTVEIFEGTKLLQKSTKKGPAKYAEYNKLMPSQSWKSLDRNFKGFEVFEFSPRKLQSYLSQPGDTFRVVLNLEGNSWPLVLSPNEMRRKGLNIKTRTRGLMENSSANVAYKGAVELPGGGSARLSLGENGMMGFVTLNGKKTFFESLSNFDPKLAREAIIAYEESALKDTTFSCAITQSDAYADQVREQVDSRATCPEYYELEIATIATFERYLAQGATVNGVNDHIIGLLNLAEANYEVFKVKFTIVEQQVIDCDNCEPWGETADIQELLSSFSSWAPGGFNITHDVGICFFKGQGFGTVGYAWIRQVCRTNFRYSVVDQLFSTTSNRVLIAHELGHNFGANHDASGAPYIMAPSVNSSTGWSSSSTSAIQAHIESRTCLACVESPNSCTPPVGSYIVENAACEDETGSLTLNFTNQPGTNTFEFSLDGGNTYPYSAPDNAGSLNIPDLAPGTYALRIRIMGTTCVTDLGNATLQRLPSPVLTVSSSPPSCDNLDGSLTFTLSQDNDERPIAFSIDGGASYPYASDDDDETFTIPNLGMGTYELWARWEDASCPTAIDTLTLQEVSSLAVCDDQDPNTVNDRYDADCICKGEFNGANAQVRVLFEGFYQSGGDSMTTVRNVARNLIPSNQPFNYTPFNYQGPESINSMPDSLVDWVLIEVRDSTDISQVIARQAVWISKSGWVHSIMGSSGIRFDNLPAGNYFLAVYHPGHLAVVTSAPIPFNIAAPVYDFTSAETQANGSGQLKLIGTRYCLFAGDFDGNGILNNLDFNLWRQNPAANNQYLPTDADGNAIINNLDYNFWSANGSKLGDAAVRK